MENHVPAGSPYPIENAKRRQYEFVRILDLTILN